MPLFLRFLERERERERERASAPSRSGVANVNRFPRRHGVPCPENPDCPPCQKTGEGRTSCSDGSSLRLDSRLSSPVPRQREQTFAAAGRFFLRWLSPQLFCSVSALRGTTPGAGQLRSITRADVPRCRQPRVFSYRNVKNLTDYLCFLWKREPARMKELLQTKISATVQLFYHTCADFLLKKILFIPERTSFKNFSG